MADARDSFVGRVEVVKALKSWLTGDLSKVSIGSIAGPAGIGKTYLLDHALRECEIGRRRYATLRFSGAHPISTLASAVQALLHGVKAHDGKMMVFPHTDECMRALEWMDIRARGEIDQLVSGNPDLAKAVADIFALSIGLAELVPIPQVQAVAKVARSVPKKYVESVVGFIQKAVAYQSEKPKIFGRKEVRLRNELRNDLAATLCTALVADLERGLAKPRFGLGGPGSRLLLIIDDYEHTGRILGDALIRCLVPRLRDAKFETLLIVLGRDRLKDTAPGWAQYHQDVCLAPPIVLDEFGRADALEYIRLRGIVNEATIERILRDTAGYPYLLAAEVDDELEGGSSALSRKNFFDRTTQWMTAEQKEWSKRLAFLDEISLETIPRVIVNADRSEATRIMEWFKSEASLRSPTAARWSLRPMIRTKLREYVHNDSETLYEQLMTSAAVPSAS